MVKLDDDASHKVKCRIAPHVHEYDLPFELSSDCTTYPLVGLRVSESIYSLMGWVIDGVDVTTVLLQT